MSPLGSSDRSLQLFREWPEFKKLLDGTEKTLRLQVEESNRLYRLFVADETIVYRTEIFKEGFVPRGWNQQKLSDNDSWRSDYMNNWAGSVNQPQRIASAAKHYNGTVDSSPTEVLFNMRCRSILIENTGNKTLLVSLDDGVAYKSLSKGSILTADVELASVWLKSNKSTTDYEIVITC